MIFIFLDGVRCLSVLSPPPPGLFFEQVVDRILGDDASKCREESVLLVERWNSGRQDYPDTSRLHDMFRESANRNRDATAIVFKVWRARGDLQYNSSTTTVCSELFVAF